MRKSLTILVILIALVSSRPAAAALVGHDDGQIKAAAEPILDNLLAGFNDDNYAKYSRDFDTALREALPEAKFQQVRGEIIEKLGKIQEQEIFRLFKPAEPHYSTLEGGV